MIQKQQHKSTFFLIFIISSLLFLAQIRAKKTIYKDVYEKLDEGDHDISSIVQTNRDKAKEPTFNGFVKKTADVILELDKNGWYKIKEIKFKDGGNPPQLSPDLLPDIRLKYEKNGYTFMHKNWTIDQASVAHQYLAFWRGGFFFKEEEINKLKEPKKRRAYMEELIRGCIGQDKANWSNKEKEKAEALDDFNIFTLGFPDLAHRYREDDPLFPIAVKISFAHEVDNLFKRRSFLGTLFSWVPGISSKDPCQVIHLLEDILQKYHSPQDLMKKIWSNAEEIKKYRESRASSGAWTTSLMQYKYRAAFWIFFIFFGYISIIKMGAAFYNFLFRRLNPMSLLPLHVIKQYTLETNPFIRLIDRYCSVKMAIRLRKFMQRRGWWTPRPTIKVAHVIYPTELTEKYIKEYLEELKYIIKANRKLMEVGKNPIYFLPNLILYGLPGNGKTLIARSIISELYAEGLIESCEVNIPELAKLGTQESGFFWQEIQNIEEPRKPLGIICNELDVILKNHTSKNTSEVQSIHVANFLSTFDEKGSPYRFCIITMNTRLDIEEERENLDGAALSRCEEFKIFPPDKEKRILILLGHLKKTGNELGIELMNEELIKQHISTHPYFNLEKAGRDLAAIANQIIIKKHKKSMQVIAKGKITKKIYLVLQDIISLLDEKMAIEEQNKLDKAR